jgi:hypothetical protein
VFITDTGGKNNRGSARRKRSLITFLQPLWYGQPKSENKILRETRKGNSRFGTRRLKEGICTDYTEYTGYTVIIRPKNMTVDQLQAGYNRFTRDYYKIMEIVYRALKQPNAVAKITGLISNVAHRLNCIPEK